MQVNHNPVIGRVKPDEAREVRSLFWSVLTRKACPHTLLGSIVLMGKAAGKCYQDEVRALAPELTAAAEALNAAAPHLQLA